MDENKNNTFGESSPGHQENSRRPNILWPAATILALAAAGIVGVTEHRLEGQLEALQANTQQQVAGLNGQLTQANNESAQRLESAVQAARDAAASAATQAENEVRKTNVVLSAKLARQLAAQRKAQEAQKETQDQVAGELDELKLARDSARSKLNELDADVSGVSRDVASTRTELQQTGTELKRVAGDMGVMSDRVATNYKELAELRALGERDYIEVALKRNGGMKKVANLQLALSKADPKKNRFTLNVVADDKRTEKKDRTINEPVQLYVSGGRLPYEIVVNEVKKDEVVGYLAVPKTRLARR